MSENDGKNSRKNKENPNKKMDREMENKRDENGNEKDDKGRFLPGWKGGPGRGNTSEDAEAEDYNISAQKVVKRLLKSKDEKSQAKGVDLYMKYKHRIDPEDTGIFSPIVKELIKVSDLARQFGGYEGMLKMLKTCRKCENFPGCSDLDVDLGLDDCQ